MQTLNVQLSSLQAANAKSAQAKKVTDQGSSFESILKSVKESQAASKTKDTRFVQSENSSAAVEKEEVPLQPKDSVSKESEVKRSEANTSRSKKELVSAKDCNKSEEKISEVLQQNIAVENKEQFAFFTNNVPSLNFTSQVQEQENSIEVVFDVSAIPAVSEDISVESAEDIQSSLLSYKTELTQDVPLIEEAVQETAGGPSNLELQENITKESDAVLQNADSELNSNAEQIASSASYENTAMAERDIAENAKPSLENDSIAKEDKEKKNEVKTSAAASQKKETSVFTIVDQRTVVPEEKEDAPGIKEEKIELSSNTDVEVQSLTGEAARGQAQQNILSSDNQSAAANGSTFQAMLSQQIQENAPEFVKAGNIILKDNNSGTINMTMKPESLGNVKISLELTDKVITGQITVHSQEAYDAFKQNLDNLRQAFQQSGFDSAGFTLNLAQNGFNGSFAQEQQQTSNEFMSNKAYGELASSGNEPSVQEAEGSSSYSKSSGYQIDVVA